jgi:hypothetical protein
MTRLPALFLIASATFAQSGGTITGTVSDYDNLGLAKAAIQAINTATGTKLSAESVAGDPV